MTSDGDDPVGAEPHECPECDRTFDSKIAIGVHKSRSHQDDAPWRDEDTLRELYHERGLSLSEVADELECNYSTVYEWMEKLDVPRREQTGSDYDSDEYEYDYTDADDLEYLYHEKDMALREMEEVLGRSQRTIRSWMTHHGIEREARHDKRRSPHASFHRDDRGYAAWTAAGFGHHDKLRVHRLLAIAEGADPYKIFSGEYHVHHRNGCKFDNRPSNIEALPESDHKAIHARENFDHINDEPEDTVGPELKSCPVCGAVGLRERIEGEHDCEAFLAAR